MTNRPNSRISQRKQPKQARSTELIATILEAAVQILATDGAQRFTTARVADRAGVSVGSIYQYFPNKASILFRLQSDEWRQTTELLRDILQDARQPPLDRLRLLVDTFIRSECDEARVRMALDDAAPLYRDAPEAQDAKAAGASIIRTFMEEALPHASDEVRARVADLVERTLTQVGKQFSETVRTPLEIEEYGRAMADMFCAYIESFASGRPGSRVR